MCVHLCVNVSACAQVVLTEAIKVWFSRAMPVPGIKLMSSARAVCSLNDWVASLVLNDSSFLLHHKACKFPIVIIPLKLNSKITNKNDLISFCAKKTQFTLSRSRYLRQAFKKKNPSKLKKEPRLSVSWSIILQWGTSSVTLWCDEPFYLLGISALKQSNPSSYNWLNTGRG